jgi:uncharacterized protein (DUF1697 family)
MAREVHIALLRGINVGGKNMLPMRHLTEIFVAAGCGDVETYIQSGNVVFKAPLALAKKVPAVVERAVLGRFGFRVPVVMRTADELRGVARKNPFIAAGADVETLAVAFLADAPPAARVAALDPNRSPRDEFAVRGRDVYLRLPDGAARSKLTNAYFDSTLGTVSTARNWRTVLALLDRSKA